MAERKKFIDVEVPILDTTIQVLGTVKNLTGRTIKLDLSRKMRGKGVFVTLRIFEKDEKLIAIPKKTELIKSYLRRVIRKRTDNVEDSFLAHCSDLRATVKPFLITRKKVSRAVRRSLRNVAREFLLNDLKGKSYYEVCEEILEGSLQKSMLPKLKKVYPLALCEIRVFDTKDLDKIDLNSIVSEKEIEEEDSPETEVAAEKEIEEGVVEDISEKNDKESEEEKPIEEEVVEKKAKKVVKKKIVKDVDKEEEEDAVKE
jgi:ribosomal protein S3AE